MKSISLKAHLLLAALFFSFISSAQDIKEKGLDERINEWFAPIAAWWEKVVLFPVTFSENVQMPFVVLLLGAGGVFFTIYFSFINFRKFGLAVQVTRGKFDNLEATPKVTGKEVVHIAAGDVVDTIKDESHHGEVNHFQALTAAVSGTMGLGNIAGVAVAIALGGPGATFWMIVCGLLGMSTKFVECTLAVKYRDIDKKGIVYGGPMYYLSKSMKNTKFSWLGNVLAILFAILCIGGALGGGNAFQANQAAAQIISVGNFEGGSAGFIIGLLLALVTGVVIIGGIKRIATVTEKVVPFMTILYILASLIIIFYHYRLIDDAIAIIFKSAFNPAAGLGGLAGVLIVGFRRAAFSNEAGAGSAAIAHSAVRTRYPASEGIVSLLEPFIDTVVVCTMTAIIIVLFNMDGHFTYGNLTENGSVILNNGAGSLGGVDLTSAAYNDVIPHFSYVLTAAILLFAFSTMISWSYYGLQGWMYLFGRSKISALIYKLIFLAFIIIGASSTLGAVVQFSDAMILAMVFPNMVGLFYLFPQVKDELNRYLQAIKASKSK